MRRIHAGAIVLSFSILGFLSASAEEKEIDWAKAREFWSFQAPSKAELPTVQSPSWVRGELDHFVLHRLEEAGLQPETEADHGTLARRLYFDLTGLPPTADQVEAFALSADRKAYSELVESLLGSPRFGERMASMWMTVARYAEDQAHQVGDNSKFFYPHAHRYRQWVIDAFNRDLPYNEFVRLQLAADSAGEGDLEALGFLGLGPQYYNRGRLDVLAEEWEDRVDTVTRAFLGLTVACARCHDHFYDPITTADYHALAGVFASTKMQKHKVGDREMHIVRDDKVKDLEIFLRGNVEDKGPKVPRGFLRILAANEERQVFTEGSGRKELAEAIIDPKNPLTARVMVNRLWGEIFGVPLVVTASNFGANGQEPTHPELLDFLAVRFQESGWSIKTLVREMVLSATYRQAVTQAEDNRLLAGMNRRRLSAEMLRDAMLAASGELDLGSGPSMKVDDAGNLRRTVFARISRKELNAFLRQFDYPDANVHAAGRASTVTPTQKLFLLNSPFVNKRASKTVEGLATREVEAAVEVLFRRVLSRSPNRSERAHALRFFEESSRDRDWAGFAQVLMCSNAFLYRD